MCEIEHILSFFLYFQDLLFIFLFKENSFEGFQENYFFFYISGECIFFISGAYKKIQQNIFFMCETSPLKIFPKKFC